MHLLFKSGRLNLVRFSSDDMYTKVLILNIYIFNGLIFVPIRKNKGHNRLKICSSAFLKSRKSYTFLLFRLCA